MLRQPPPPLYELGGYRQSPSAATLPKQAHQDKAEFAAAPEQAPPLGPTAAGIQASARSPTRDVKTEQQQLRRKINSRERKRMQDLNLAMDALREVILPYSAAHCQSTPGRKLSKIATLLLARNYILLLGSSLQELRRILGEISGSAGGPRLLLAGLPLFAAAAAAATAPSAGPVLLASPANGNHHHHHHHHHHPPHSDGGSGGLRSANKYLSLALEEQQMVGGRLPSATSSLCPCALCKFPHFMPSPPGLVALGPAGVQAQFSK